MLKAVIDASIVLKWFSEEREEAVNQARQIYQFLRDNKIAFYAPQFLLVETLNILAKKKQISPALQKKAMRLLTTSGITFTSLSPQNTISLVAVIKKHDLTAYDALYIALAQEKKCRLLTVDVQLLTIPRSFTPTQLLESTEI